MLRGLGPAKAMQDILPNLAPLERAHQEYTRQALASKGFEFTNMRQHGIQVYPEVFKKADLLNTLPDGVVKELKKSTNLEVEADTHDEICDAVTTIVHNHMNVAAPMDVEKRIIAMLGADNHDRGYDKDCTADPYDAHDDCDEELYVNYIGKGQCRLADEGGQEQRQTEGQARRHMLVVWSTWSQKQRLLEQRQGEGQAEGRLQRERRQGRARQRRVWQRQERERVPCLRPAVLRGWDVAAPAVAEPRAELGPGYGMEPRERTAIRPPAPINRAEPGITSRTSSWPPVGLTAPMRETLAG